MLILSYAASGVNLDKLADQSSSTKETKKLGSLEARKLGGQRRLVPGER